jgi:hypothetical protein
MLKHVKTANEIKLEGIVALNKSLGPADAMRFLTYLHREPTDYVKVSHCLYEEQSLDDIFQRAKKEAKHQK